MGCYWAEQYFNAVLFGLQRHSNKIFNHALLVLSMINLVDADHSVNQ